MHAIAFNQNRSQHSSNLNMIRMTNHHIARSARRSIGHVRFMVRTNQRITGEADSLFALTSAL
ncbi:MAG: hypothetical protein DWI00_10125 [Planctomycetota bacterium]|nr:MAG: hypothetical protein DWI00_10125 [Planctomycetota bacterium]